MDTLAPGFFANGSWSLPSNLTFNNVTNDVDNDGFHSFLQAYCINPPDDSCYFPGRCPNSDVASILVRVATYVTAFCLGNFLLFDENEVEGTFTGQMLYMYSLLLTTAVAIAKKTITRFHTEIISLLVGSPLSFMLLVYSIIGFFRHHRISSVLGPDKKTLFYRLIVIASFVFWLGGLIFTERESSSSSFTQSACDPRTASDVSIGLTILPYAAIILLFMAASEDKSFTGSALIFAIPVILLLIASVLGLILKRKLIFGKPKPGEHRFWTAWSVMAKEYPFIHWAGIHFLPTLYWIFVSESFIADGGVAVGLTHDNHFELTFGGMLAILVIVQPVWSTIKMMPRTWGWFIDLAWVRLLTCRRRKNRASSNELSFDMEDQTKVESMPISMKDISRKDSGMYPAQSTSSFSVPRLTSNGRQGSYY